MFAHTDASKVGVMIRIEDKEKGPETVLVVTTTLQLDPDAADYDSKRVGALVDAASDYMREHNSTIDAVQFHSER